MTSSINASRGAASSQNTVKITFSQLANRTCRLMQEYVATANDLLVNSHRYHSGVGGFDDKRTISIDPFYEAQDTRIKNIIKYLNIFKAHSNARKHFSSEQITNAVEPFFDEYFYLIPDELNMEGLGLKERKITTFSYNVEESDYLEKFKDRKSDDKSNVTDIVNYALTDIAKVLAELRKT